MERSTGADESNTTTDGGFSTMTKSFRDSPSDPTVTSAQSAIPPGKRFGRKGKQKALQAHALSDGGDRLKPA